MRGRGTSLNLGIRLFECSMDGVLGRPCAVDVTFICRLHSAAQPLSAIGALSVLAICRRPNQPILVLSHSQKYRSHARTASLSLERFRDPFVASLTSDTGSLGHNISTGAKTTHLAPVSLAHLHRWDSETEQPGLPRRAYAYSLDQGAAREESCGCMLLTEFRP